MLKPAKMKYILLIILFSYTILNCKSVNNLKKDNNSSLLLNLSLQGDSLVYEITNYTNEDVKIPPNFAIAYGWGCDYYDKKRKLLDINRYNGCYNPSIVYSLLKPGMKIIFLENIYDQIPSVGIDKKGTYLLQFNVSYGGYKSNLLKVNFDPSKDPRWDTSKDGPMLEAIRIDTTNAEYVGFWIKNNNHKRKLKLKDLRIICDSIEDAHGLMTCDTKDICTYNAREMNDYLKEVFVIKVNRSFVQDLKVFDRIRFGGLAIFHNEDRDHMISINRTLSKFEYH